MKLRRPLLRYHGGKWKLADWIISHFPNHRVYVEAFGGGGSVLLKKTRSYAEVYNDLDLELVNLFTVTRDHGYELHDRLKLTPFARTEFFGSYQPTSDPIEQARRTVIRSFMGFGSNSHNKKTGFRANSNRSGTTPAHDWKSYPAALDGIIERLRGVVIENKNAIDVMRAHDSEQTLHYVDPPYLFSERDAGSDYRHELTDEQHTELLNALIRLRGMVVLSGYENALYDEILGNWQKVYRKTYADGAKRRIEVLWISPNFRIQESLF